jgi:hypothetical protein
MKSPATRRARALALVRAQLTHKGSPFLVLFLVLTVTGLTGFLASVLLRWAGLSSMGVRYPVCVALAYLAFLFQLFLYVLYHRHRVRVADRGAAAEAAGDVAIDVVDVGVDVADAPAVAVVSAGSKSEGKGWLDSAGGGGDDGAAVVVVVIVMVVLVVVGLVASIVVLVEAPLLLAELLVDGVLLAGMARRMRRAHPGDWVFSVIRRTWVPALVVAVVFAAGGFALQLFAPGATTMLEVLGRTAGG